LQRVKLRVLEQTVELKIREKFMKTFEIESTRNLSEHDKVLQAVLDFFYKFPGVVGCFLSGSVATNEMDEDSDLDIGILFQSADDRERSWQKRWEWEITSWFHRFDADHIKPYFVIYFNEPQIQTDINLYIENDLPPVEGGPYTVVWDQTGVLKNWGKMQSEHPKSTPSWQAVVHEDERFWAWSFYVYRHLHRGEYYHIAYAFSELRDVIEKWVARLAGYSRFGTRRLEKQAFGRELLAYDLFPKPKLESLKRSMVNLLEIQLLMRKRIEEEYGIKWKTTDEAIEKISKLISDL
jgi:hypothetical protein